jgi:hypothetical protein
MSLPRGSLRTSSVDRNGKLCRLPKAGYTNERIEVFVDSRVFHLVAAAHVASRHRVGATLKAVQRQFSGILYEEIKWITDNCSICQSIELVRTLFSEEPHAEASAPDGLEEDAVMDCECGGAPPQHPADRADSVQYPAGVDDPAQCSEESTYVLALRVRGKPIRGDLMG